MNWVAVLVIAVGVPLSFWFRWHQHARRYDNTVVTKLNRRIDAFPSNILARRMRMQPAEYFERE